jgi:acyl-coenzyme A synthetase/AMP-(fatty) acid ligase
MHTNPNMTDYEKAYKAFQIKIPEYYNFADQVIDKWAQDSEKLALLWVDDRGNEVRKTFKEISLSSKKAANALLALGITRGDKILLMLSRQIAWWEIITACIRIGAVAIPAVTMLTTKDIQFRANQSKAGCIITDPIIAAKLDHRLSKCPTIKHRIVVDEPYKNWTFYQDMVSKASDRFKTIKTKSTDSSLIYFTSTTEGAVKMAIHTHASSAIAHEVTGRFWLDLKPDDLHWNLSETGWAKTAWSSYFGPWHMGAAVFIYHTLGFNPKNILKQLATYPITTLCATTTIYRMLVLQNLNAYQFSHLRHCVGAGEPMTPEIIEIWKNDTGCVIQNGYGQTETGLLTANFPCLETRLDSIGKPVPGVTLAIVDPFGKRLPPNEEGIMAIKIKPEFPVGFFAGYGIDEDQDDDRYIGPWYLTSDRAIIDQDGYFWFKGRTDDVILSAGYRINPIEVEHILMEHPAVVEAAAVSSPDKTRGQVVKAFIVLSEDYDPTEALAEELQNYVKTMIQPYKYPRKIQFVAELPKTFSGKIRRVDLRQSEWR